MVATVIVTLEVNNMKVFNNGILYQSIVTHPLVANINHKMAQEIKH